MQTTNNLNILDCVVNIDINEILTIVPLIGSLCQSAGLTLNILKFNFTNKKTQLENILNLDIIKNICLQYKSLIFNNNILSSMPERADIYFTTDYLSSHCIMRQYTRYIFIYHNISQLEWRDGVEKKAAYNVRRFFHYDAIILMQPTTPSLKQTILEYFPPFFKEKINNYFDKYTYQPDRTTMEIIKQIDPDTYIFNKIYEFGIWVDERSLLTRKDQISFSGDGSDIGTTNKVLESLGGFINEYNITQIIDLSCGDMKWMSVLLNNQKTITHYHGNDVSLVALKLAQKNIIQRDGLSITFSNNNISSPKFSKKLNKIVTQNSLILIRLTIQHMSNQEIMNTFKNLIKYVKFKYIICSSIQPLVKINDEWRQAVSMTSSDINRGGYRDINLDDPPYSNARPFTVLDDQIHFMGQYQKEIITLYCYTNETFKALKNMKNYFIKKIIREKNINDKTKINYTFFKINKIHKLLEKKNTNEVNNQTKIWYSRK